MTTDLTRRQIWDWLDTVPDPEIPVISVVDLGVVRDVEVRGGKVAITITPTYSGCPAMAIIALDIKTALAKHGVQDPDCPTLDHRLDVRKRPRQAGRLWHCPAAAGGRPGALPALPLP